MEKLKYNSCDICYKENKDHGKNIVKFNYQGKNNKPTIGVMDICSVCAETYEKVKSEK